MFVEKRRENYDELLLLASDARARRTRTNRWSTGIVVTAMLGMAAYVAAMSQQMSEVRDAAKEAQQERDRTVELLSQRQADYNTLQADVNAMQRFQELYAELLPSQSLSNAISGIGGTVKETTIEKSNIVWMVEGSRRFPMIDGDVLWIPEGGFWVRLRKVNNVRRLYRESSPSGGAINSANPESKLITKNPYREPVPKNNYDCVEIELHDESLRPVFKAQKYVDVEVTYFRLDDGQVCQ